MNDSANKAEPIGEETQDKYCSTREAAKMMGVSLRTAQLMVERGLLQAWKTSGGHRRILLDSVRQYLRERERGGNGGRDAQLSILVVEDDDFQRETYQAAMKAWGLPVTVSVAEHGYDALVMIGREPPDILIADLIMPEMDGFEMIRRLRANRNQDTMDIIVVSAMSASDITSRNTLPNDITVLGKPVPFDELRGYVQARLADRRRSPLA